MVVRRDMSTAGAWNSPAFRILSMVMAALPIAVQGCSRPGSEDGGGNAKQATRAAATREGKKPVAVWDGHAKIRLTNCRALPDGKYAPVVVWGWMPEDKPWKVGDPKETNLPEGGAALVGTTKSFAEHEQDFPDTRPWGPEVRVTGPFTHSWWWVYQIRSSGKCGILEAVTGIITNKTDDFDIPIVSAGVMPEDLGSFMVSKVLCPRSLWFVPVPPTGPRTGSVWPWDWDTVQVIVAIDTKERAPAPGKPE